MPRTNESGADLIAALQIARDHFYAIQRRLEEHKTGEASSIAYDAAYAIALVLARAEKEESGGVALERVLDRLKWLVEYGVEINLRKDEAEVLLAALERRP